MTQHGIGLGWLLGWLTQKARRSGAVAERQEGISFVIVKFLCVDLMIYIPDKGCSGGSIAIFFLAIFLLHLSIFSHYFVLEKKRPSFFSFAGKGFITFSSPTFLFPPNRSHV
jgi:hypothetical protein